MNENLDSVTPPESFWDLKEVAGRGGRAAGALALRQVAVLGTNLGCAVWFARALAPSEYAFYGVALLLFGVFQMAADAGLGTALIRRQEKPTDRELRAVTTAQATLAGVFATIGWTVAPTVVAACHAPSGTLTFIRCALLTACLTALHTTPLIRLERQLAFGRIGVVNLAGSITFNGTALYGISYAHWGIASFGVAMIAQETVGAGLLWIASPWRPGIVLRSAGLRKLARFGLPFQASALLAVGKDAAVPIVLGGLVSATAVGYAQWASQLAVIALYATMILQRVYLPAFSRLQHDRIALGSLVQASSDAVHLLIAPFAVLLLVSASNITDVVFGAQWRPALPLFYILWIINVTSPSTGPLTALLNATGKVGRTFQLSLGWFALQWGLTLALAPFLGIYGFGVAVVAQQGTALILVHWAKKEAPFTLMPGFVGAWSCAAASGAVVYLVAKAIPGQTAGLFGGGALGLALYAILLTLFRRQQTRSLFQLFRGVTPVTKPSTSPAADSPQGSTVSLTNRNG